VDATFLFAGQRKPFIEVAHDRQIPVVILDVWAPKEVLAQRIERRATQQTDASDATIDVMERQKTLNEPFTEAERSHVLRIDSTDMKSVSSTIKTFLEQRRKESCL
jgi:predicted kinase